MCLSIFSRPANLIWIYWRIIQWKEKIFYEARERALNNDHGFHIAAILYRRGKPVTISVNSWKQKPKYFRYYSKATRPGRAYCQHAEMSALESAKPGDKIEVIRFRCDGSIGCAKPCPHCEKRLRKLNIRVRYTNHDGEWEWLTTSWQSLDLTFRSSMIHYMCRKEEEEEMFTVFGSVMGVVGTIFFASEVKAKHACRCDKGEWWLGLFMFALTVSVNMIANGQIAGNVIWRVTDCAASVQIRGVWGNEAIARRFVLLWIFSFLYLSRADSFKNVLLANQRPWW